MREREMFIPPPERLEERPLTFEELEQKEGLQLVDHVYGNAKIREYLDISKNPYLPPDLVQKYAEGALSKEQEKKYRELLGFQNVADIAFLTPEEKLFLFSSLLPKDYHFVRYDGRLMPSSNYDYKDILYGKIVPLGRLAKTGNWAPKKIVMFETPGSVVTMFHELGHAHDQSALSQEENERRLALHKKLEKGPLARRYFSEYKKTIVPSERNAWAWALRTLRKVRDDGIDLEPDMDNEALQLFVHQNLLSYEIPLGREDESWKYPWELDRRLTRPKRERPKEK